MQPKPNQSKKFQAFKDRPLRVITPEYLEKAALYYLQRYASSVDNLRQLLLRRLKRSKVDRDPKFIAMAEETIEKIKQKGLLDDQNFAWHRIKSLNQAGKSMRRIKANLQQKGVSEDDLQAALEKLLADYPDMEWQAAAKFARRKKIGPFRPPGAADINPRRELQQLAQAGFSYTLAKKLIDYSEDDDGELP